MAGIKYPDMWADPEDDPRESLPVPDPADERGVLMQALRWNRMTLELKCADLGPVHLAERSVPPAKMSLLGLVRHMADVEHGWFRRRMAGHDIPGLYRRKDDPDGDFDGAVADPAVVEASFAAWRAEMAFTDDFVASAPDLMVTGIHPHSGPITLRALLVHMVEEYGRHLGHADLIRERIDGRTGQ